MATTREDVGCSVAESVFEGVNLQRNEKAASRTVTAGYNCLAAGEWTDAAAGTA